VKWFLSCLLAIGLSSAFADEKLVPSGGKLDPPLLCDDFLKAIGLQRPDVKFVTCKPGEFGGIDNLSAEYRIEGKDVINVENWLVKLAHVSRLKRACCIWETGMKSFRGRDGADYEVSMSAQSTVSDRRNLTKVPSFSLTVTHYLYSP
jgi:hypothetical protein